MFRSQSSDHHQGSITVLVQLLLIGVHASSYSGMWLYAVCAYDVPVPVVSGYVRSCFVTISRLPFSVVGTRTNVSEWTGRIIPKLGI